MSGRNVIIIGAAGRDFHNFNTCFRDNEDYNIVAFTAAQIPDIEGRKYPSELVDPRPFTVGKLSETFKTYPDIGTLLPAMGYGEEQLKDLGTTINNADCDSAVIGTPIDLNRIIKIEKPTTGVYYDLQEIGNPDLDEVLDEFILKHKLI